MARSWNARSICLIGLVSAAWPAAGVVVAQQKVSFVGKSVTMTIGNAGGGGTDLYGRLVGRHLMVQLPGQPSLIVLNQPGAGGVIALNSWTIRAPNDGLAITIGAGSQCDPAALAQTKAKYDPKDFKYVGGRGGHSQALFINNHAVERLYDKSLPPVIVGTVAGTLRGGNFQALWGAAFLGWNLKWVQGYPDSAQIRQALERGEIDMMSVGSDSDIDYVLNLGRFKVISQTGVMRNGQPVAREDLQGAPIFATLVEGKIKDPLAQKAFDYWNNLRQIGSWVALPPKTPDPIVSTYVEAFNQMSKNKAYLEEIDKLDPGAPMATNMDLEHLMDQLSRVSPQVIDYVQAEQLRQGIGR